MRQKWVFIMLSAVLAAVLAVAGTKFVKSEETEIRDGSIKLETKAEENFPDMAKIKLLPAVQTAITAVPGKLLKAELENENGFLVYSIEVVTADKAIMDVKVDAGTGKILATNRDRVDDEEHDSDDNDYDRDLKD